MACAVSAKDASSGTSSTTVAAAATGSAGVARQIRPAMVIIFFVFY